MAYPLTTKPGFGCVLVVGGCGFLGHHIVQHILARQDGTKIAVMSRSADKHLFPGVEYIKGNITCEESVREVFDKIRPTVVINTVAPITFPLRGTPESHYKLNVDGTSHLLRAAAESKTTVALVYTSSAHVVKASDYLDAKECDQILLDPKSSRFPTSTKAIAEEHTRNANNTLPIEQGGLRTATIRPCSIFGENDSQLLPTILSQLDAGQQNVQIGSNTALYDFVYVGNVAEAHILAAEALVREAGHPARDESKVSGESFFITNDDPWHFYDFMREVWHTSGYDTTKLKPRIIPTRAALALGTTNDWTTWAISFGRKSPSSLSRENIEHLCLNRTHNIMKAKTRLGYVPTTSIREGIERGVKSFLAG